MNIYELELAENLGGNLRRLTFARLCVLIGILNFIAFKNELVAGTIPLGLDPLVIYGEDERTEVFGSVDRKFIELAKSTAAMIPNQSLIISGDKFILNARKLHEFQICSSEPFANQPAASKCSGFLIDKRTLVTAGHCINTISDCENVSWAFGYSYFNESALDLGNPFSFLKNQIYKCTEIIKRVKNAETKEDFAVLRLDREVANIIPLRIRRSGKVSDSAIMTVIGNPKGLPTKIAPVADIRDNSEEIYFKINSDTYKGNSGSPVINSKTGIVEGILVRGDNDFIKTEEGCFRSVINSQQGGRGEDATRITRILLP